jgi:hypothetical protein
MQSTDASSLARIREMIVKDPAIALLVGELLGPPPGLRFPPAKVRLTLEEGPETCSRRPAA